MKTKIINLITIISCWIFAFTTLLLGVNLLGAYSSKNDKKISAASSVGEIWNMSTNTFNFDNLDALVRYLTGDSSTSLGRLPQAAYSKSATELSRVVSQVTFGGMDWYPVRFAGNGGYFTLTLWLKSHTEMSKLGLTSSCDWASVSGDQFIDSLVQFPFESTNAMVAVSFPPSTYSNSYIRAVGLGNGGTYGSYQLADIMGQHQAYLLSESSLTASVSGLCTKYKNMENYISKYTFDGKSDMFWLPSENEVGTRNDWQIPSSMQTSYYAVRDARSDYYTAEWTGSYWSSTYVDNTLYLRPCVSLDLTKIASALPRYTINYYDTDSSSVSKSEEWVYGKSLPSTTKPTKTGYIFKGYFTSRDGKGTRYYDKNLASIDYNSKSNLNLYAYWTPVSSKLTFNPNQGTISSDLQNDYYNYGEGPGQKKNLYDPTRVSLPVGITRSGNVFTLSVTPSSTGWYNFNMPFNDMLNPSTKYTYVINCTSFSGSSFHVTFTSPYEASSQGLGDPATDSSGVDIAAAKTYKGTFTTKSSISASTEFNFRTYTQLTGGVKYYAQFTISLFVGNANYTNFTYAGYGSTNTSLTLPTEVTREGYTFSGWYTSSSSGSQVLASETYSTTTAKTVYAHWSEISYTLQLNANGGRVDGEATKNVTLSYTQSYSLPTPIYEGRNFLGWYTSSNTKKTGSVSKLTSKNNDIYTLTAHWEDTWICYAATSIKSGGGSQGNPYQISSAAELAFVAAQVNKGAGSYGSAYYIQTQDITNLADHVWAPIGTSANQFSGHYDGQQHIISGYKSSSLNFAEVGIFGVINGADVRNVVTTGGQVKGNDYVGAIAGYVAGESVIEHCINTTRVVGTGSCIGGIAGYSENSDIIFCANYGYVDGSIASDSIGGIVGYQLSGLIKNCYAKCTVNGDEGQGLFGSGALFVGGIAGLSGGAIQNSGFMGEIVGYLVRTTVGALGSNTYNDDFKMGAICCYDGDYIDYQPNIENCFAVSSIYGNFPVPFVCGSASITDCLYRRNDTRNNTTAKLYYTSGTFSSWVKIDSGLGLGFLPQGFAWVGMCDTPTSLSEITTAGFSQG